MNPFEALPLGVVHRRRLREVWRSAGWPCQDTIEIELLAAGLLERCSPAGARETLRVSDAGIQVLARTLQGNRALRDRHESLVARVALELQRGGRIAWCGLSLRAAVADSERPQGRRWLMAMPDVFSVRNTTVAAYLRSAVHEIKARRADLLADLRRADKRAAYLAMAGECWYVLAEGIAEPDEVPLECGVMLARGSDFSTLEVVRAAPVRAMPFEAGLPFAVWMALAVAAPVPRPDDDGQRWLGQPEGDDPWQRERGTRCTMGAASSQHDTFRSATMTRPSPRFSRNAAAVLFCALAWSGAADAAAGPPSTNVAWVSVAADAEVDAAFVRAKAESKPLLLYWGASWCPPCNQLKATLFNRQDFAAQSKSFVAVHVDGDRPAAQKLGARFKVSGYPTLVLFTPEGREITRLPGEADAPQVMSLLQAGLSGGRPVAAVLGDARAGKPLSANEWRLLSFHSWDVDESGLVERADRPAVLAELAAKSPSGDGETSTRLWLKALAASDEGKGIKPDTALRQRVQRVLADAAQSRLHMDVLVSGSSDMAKALSDDDSAERAPLVAQFDSALARLQADASLSRGDRVSALIERIDLARLGQAKETTQPKLPPALVQQVRELAARMDREITDGYERQAVITAVAYMQGQAGLWSDSDALLKANLAKSHSPYYLMSQLGSNAKKLGRKDEALRWYQQAFDKSEGPATRLQWGASYVSALVELAPRDAARIEKAASQIFAEAARDPGAFHERSARALQRVGNKLASWNADGKHAATLKRLRAQLDPVCARIDAAQSQRAACNALLPRKS